MKLPDTQRILWLVGGVFGVVLIVLIVLLVREQGKQDGVFALSLELSNLQPLDGAQYEAWVSFLEPSVEVSLGKFNIDRNGNFVSPAGDVVDAFTTTQPLSEAARIFVTVEPLEDSDSASSGVEIVSGQLEGGRAVMRFRQIDLDTAEGAFVVQTPTEDDDQASRGEKSGVWFFATTSNGEQVATLSLPELPEEWVYDAWVQYATVDLLLGSFESTNAPDSLSGFGGGVSQPSFPGEDVIYNLPETLQDQGIPLPPDFTNGIARVVVGLRPKVLGVQPERPYQLQFLNLRIPPGSPTGVAIALNKDLETGFPEGTAYIEEAQ